jgi:hypothetical protein
VVYSWLKGAVFQLEKKFVDANGIAPKKRKGTLVETDYKGLHDWNI